MRHPNSIKALLTAATLLLYIGCSSSWADKNNIHKVKDLDYGVALFHFFQEKNFSAITDLLVAEHYKRLKSGDKNPRLLLGGLYLSYDLHDQSADIFKQLLDDKDLNTPLTIQDRAWYLLGKNYYQNNFLAESELALKNIKDTLQADDEAEKLYLLNTIYLRDNKTEQATKILDQIPADSIWKSYAQFNTAVYLIKKQNTAAKGHELLSELANTDAPHPEKKIIKDKANLALAFVALKDKQSQLAIDHFNKVRLKGTETNKALIGLGWGLYRQKKYDDATIPWLNLASSQTESDLAVQEALISVPYAFEKMQEKEKALYQYDLAIASYKFQLEETQKLLNHIKSQNFIRELNPGSLGNESTPIVSIIKNINPLMTRYLLPLLTSDRFQHAIKSYQEIVHLEYKMNRWENSMPALHMILKEKRKTYKHKLAHTVNDDSLDRVNALTQKHKKLSIELRQIEGKQIAIKLATADELEKLTLLNTSEKRLKKLKDSDEDTNEQADKLRLLKGLMTWKIDTDFPVRIWKAKRQMQQLDLAIQNMKKAIHSLKASWKQAPADFSTFDKRIQNKESQIQTLRSQLKLAINTQKKYLRKMALDALKLHRNQIKLYHDRALYSKARLYDSLMARE